MQARFLSFLLFLAIALAARAEEEAASLLKKMQAAYSAVSSYSDEISVHFRNPDLSAGAQAEGKVWFQRPSLFRIDAQSRRAPDAPPKREVMWADGKSVRSWSTTNPVSTHAKVQLAGSKMFGTYAYHVPTLLDASFGGPRRLHQLDDPTMNGEEIFEGTDCYRIRGTWLGDPYEVWLGKNDFFVRKINADYKGYGMEEIHRHIAIDQNIPKEAFQFAPEKDAAPAKK